MQTKTTNDLNLELNLPDQAAIENELVLVESSNISAESISTELKAKADQFVDTLFNLGERELSEQRRYSKSIDTLGDHLEKELQRKSKFLGEPARLLVQSNKDEAPIEVSLQSIYKELKKIDPNQVNLSMSGFRSLLAKLPFIGDPLTEWVLNYLSVGTVIDDMVRSMQSAVSEMKRDNDTLLDDQIAMKELAFKLEDVVRWAMYVDQAISARLESSGDLGEAKKRFIEEEVLYVLKQKIISQMELQNINRQGVLVSESIIRGNKELIRGYENGIKSTMAAIRIAAALAVSLEKQNRNRRVLTAINDYKGKVVRHTGEQLLQNTKDIIAESATAGARIEDLNAGFNAALESFELVSEFKRNLLPKLSADIGSLNEISEKLATAVEKFTDDNSEEKTANSDFLPV